jgi:cytoskeletal protein RodZ
VTEELHKLGEVLRSAREAKGLDLPRVERETKIRARYLSALERGEYRELPGAVYTKGFLRNYGLYLGLDPEYLVDLYRLESASALAERPSMPVPPRPIATRRARAFVVTPGAVVAAILTALVSLFVIWIGWEFYNFAGTPDLRILEPAGTVASHPETSYTIRGITEPNARITIAGAVENPTINADEEGSFSVVVELVPGSNFITLTAFDPVTRRDSAPQSRTIIVETATASPTPASVALTLDQPAADAVVGSPVPIAGHASPGAALQVTATMVAAPTPSFTVVDGGGQPVAIRPAAPAPPAALAVSAGGDGAYTAQLTLSPATWDVTVSAADSSGTPPVTRRIRVSEPAGLAGMLRIDGGQSYLELDQDGEAASVSGDIANPGDVVALDADRELRIRAGNAAAVRLTINGLDIGAMGGQGAVVEWRITRASG